MQKQLLKNVFKRDSKTSRISAVATAAVQAVNVYSHFACITHKL